MEKLIFSYQLHCSVRMKLLNDVCFVLHVTPLYPFSLVVRININVQDRWLVQ